MILNALNVKFWEFRWWEQLVIKWEQFLKNGLNLILSILHAYLKKKINYIFNYIMFSNEDKSAIIYYVRQS